MTPHDHTHTHHHHPAPTGGEHLNRAFKIGILLNAVFVAAEFFAGFRSNSMGLISDAGHNLSDIASLLLALIAFRLSRVRPSSRYTYGYKKSTILVSLLNAVILLIAVGFILTESISKLIHPQPVEGSVIIWVAGIGVLINGLTAWLFVKDKEKDLNIKGAYLHMAADALVSVGVVVSGILISFTEWYFIDPIIGIVIAIVITVSTWSLLRDSLNLSLDGVPADIDAGEIERIVREIPGITEVHHLHIWAISTTETALTAHIRLADGTRSDAVKQEAKRKLSDAGITHATLETETAGTPCKDAGCTFSDH